MTDSVYVALVINKMNYLKINSKQLSEMVDMNHGALNAILAEKVRMTLGVALKIAQVLEVPLDPLTSIANNKARMN